MNKKGSFQKYTMGLKIDQKVKLKTILILKEGEKRKKKVCSYKWKRNSLKKKRKKRKLT